MRQFFQRLTEAVIIDIVKTILIALASVVVIYVFNGILIQKIPEVKDYKNELSVVYIVLTIYVLLVLYSKIVVRYRPKKLDFEILEKQIYHRLKNKDQVIHRRTFKLKALKKDIQFFSDKFLWTGGKYEIKCLNEKYVLNLLPEEISHYDTYIIRFDRLLQKGDIVEFTVEWNCKDEEGKARPFFSTTILEPVQKLVMKLQVDDDLLQIDKAHLDVAYTEGGDIRSVEDRQMVNCITEWVIEKPKMLHYYKVRWILK